MSKSRGGLGFRDLHGFNLALLGKQCWNLINNPGTLVARVLKARYYSDCHLLQARRTGGSSYTWSGIWEAKEVIKDGLRWVLGDGKTINIYTDRWLRGKDDFRVDQMGNWLPEENVKVSDFFLSDSKAWDERKIRNTFNNTDAEAILTTRTSQGSTEDRLAWVHSSSGQYTVRSGYQQWQLNHFRSGGIRQSNGWDMIWHLNVPHKIKIFLWRFARNTIPVRNLLRGKGIRAPVACAMCVGDVEHMLHLFLDCRFAAACWKRIGLGYDFAEVENASEWLLDRMENETSENKIKIVTVLWGIWYARNKRVWEDKRIPPDVTITWSSKQIAEWREAQRKKVLNSAGRKEGNVQ